MTAPVPYATVGTPGNVRLDGLRLDPYNPRLPPSQHGKSQQDLAVVLEMGFDAFTVAESLARHGYFVSEPLIVIPDDAPGTYLVIEGNRRLTALLGLTSESIRREFAAPDRWHQLASQCTVTLDTQIPVVIATSRASCTPVVGFRHISGILQWSPFSQARYIASLVDGSGQSFEEVHKLIGIDKRDVANLYREQAIADQAQRLGINTGNLEASFSLLQVAMSNTKLREFVGAPLGLRLAPGEPPIPETRRGQLGELLGYIFGNGEHEPVINDSRQIAQLGNVVAEPRGLEALRAGETLEAAKQKIADAAVDPKERLRKRLTAAKNALSMASEDMPQFYGDSEISALMEDIEAAMTDLQPPIE
jgi:hypothetical protein